MATLGAIVACGDDDSSAIPPPAPDGGASSGSSTSGSTSSGSTGTSSSSGGPTDGGASSSSSSGDLASNPAQLSCGATVCDAGFTSSGGPNVCCQAANGTNTKCLTRNECDNSGNNGNLRVQCDEAADCIGDHAGEICCYLKQNFGQPTFSALCEAPDDCRMFQPGEGQVPRPQLCKTNAECGDAGACNEKMCDGFKLHVCGSPVGCK